MPRSSDSDPASQHDREDYRLLDLLDRLEELIEEMDDLGVTSREEAERRIAELEAALGDGRDDAGSVR